MQPQVQIPSPIPVRWQVTARLGHVIYAGGVPRDRPLPSVSDSRPARSATSDGRVGGGGPLCPPTIHLELRPLVLRDWLFRRTTETARRIRHPQRRVGRIWSRHAGRGIDGLTQFDVSHLLGTDGPGAYRILEHGEMAPLNCQPALHAVNRWPGGTSRVLCLSCGRPVESDSRVPRICEACRSMSGTETGTPDRADLDGDSETIDCGNGRATDPGRGRPGRLGSPGVSILRGEDAPALS
jgi:hypothetical protein